MVVDHLLLHSVLARDAYRCPVLRPREFTKRRIRRRPCLVFFYEFLPDYDTVWNVRHSAKIYYSHKPHMNEVCITTPVCIDYA